MGKYDDAMYRYLKDNARFADLFNAAAFDGKEVLKPEMLEADDGRYVITKRKRDGKIQSGNRHRDIKKRTKDGRFLAVTAIENQEVIDYTMPLRMMQYDEMEYEEQLRRIRKQKEGALKEKGRCLISGIQILIRMINCNRFIRFVCIMVQKVGMAREV